MNKKRYLFFFVHPAKVHLFRKTINTLKANGHHVDVIITGRDILEEMVINEGWEYKKIFPNGRRIKNVHIYISASIFLFLTILKLLRYTWGKKYHFFITDDVLTFVGRIKGVPSIYAGDDDLEAVPESAILMVSANYIFAPEIADLKQYNSKKIGYYGYKAISHLHPNHFTPERSKLIPELQEQNFFFLRTVSHTSTHDMGKRGINDDALRRIVDKLKPHGRVILNSERELPKDLSEFTVDFKKNDVGHYLNYAKLFISDSTTMCVEAAVLGTPAIEIDDWFSDFTQYQELNEKYKLVFGFRVDQETEIFNKIDELLSMDQLENVFQSRRMDMLNDKVDVASFLTWIIENYPESVKEFFSNKEMQKRFR